MFQMLDMNCLFSWLGFCQYANLRIRLVDCNRNCSVIAIPMVQFYSCLVMFLLLVIIIPYESLFLKMRNRHSLLKVLNPYSLAKRNMLCLSKIPKIPLYLRLLQKFLSPCSINKNPKIPHYLYFLQNFSLLC